MRGQQSGECRRARLQRLQEQARVVQLLCVGRVLQEIDRFLVGSCFLFRNVLEAKVLVRCLVGEEHAVVEGILAAQVVSQHDVREFMGKHHCQAGLIRQVRRSTRG